MRRSANTPTLEVETAAASNGHSSSHESSIDPSDADPTHRRRSATRVPPGRTPSWTPAAIPGRPRRRPAIGRKRKRGFCYRLYARWIKGCSSLILAVILWYSLGVISIGSSKYLLMSHDDHFGSVPPLYLTLQQLLIGTSLLRFLLHVRFMNSPGLQPWPTATSTSPPSPSRRYSGTKPKSSMFQDYQPSLVLAAIYFGLGFLATNYGFSSAPASFVETIKAAEPITSASVAVWNGIEVLSREEVVSLLGIVAGVLLSTLGNHHSSQSASAPVTDSVQACLVVMASNLCFSFRGLYQKLFRATPEGSASVMDDLNLQFRMQQIGVIMLIVPVLVWDFPSMAKSIWHISTKVGILRSGLLLRYLGFSILNGCAFTCYNLASTYILSRISVVHHAALNCLRRIFAIIVTSILFQVRITLTGAAGILCSVLGFMAFSHYKVQRQTQPKPLSSLLPISAVQ